MVSLAEDVVTLSVRVLIQASLFFVVVAGVATRVPPRETVCPPRIH